MIMARSQSQADQSSRIGNGLRLPAMVRLIAAHGGFTRFVPGSRRFSAQVMLANQGFLNFLRPLGIDFLLTPRHLLALAGCRLPALTVVRYCGCLRFGMRRRAMRRCMTFAGRFGRRRSLGGFFRRSRRLASGRLRIRLAGAFRSSRRSLRPCRTYRNTGADQRHRAACSQPSPNCRFMLSQALLLAHSNLKQKTKPN